MWPETKNLLDKSYTVLSKQNDLNDLSLDKMNESDNNRINNVVNTDDLSNNQNNVADMQDGENISDENEHDGYNLKEKEDASHHKINKEFFECAFCKKIFPSKFLLKKHLILKHNNNTKLKSKIIKSRRDHQHESVQYDKNDVENMSYESDDDDNDDDNDKKKEDDSSHKIKELVFKCIICKKIFPSNFLLQKHLIRKHKNTKRNLKSNQSRMTDHSKDENEENKNIVHELDDQIRSQEHEKVKHDDGFNLKKGKESSLKTNRTKPYFNGKEKKSLLDNNLFNSSDINDQSLDKMNDQNYKQTMKQSNLKNKRLKPYVTIRKDDSGYICMECDISFRNYSSLYNHIKKMHKNDDMDVTFPSLHSKYRAIAKLKQDQYQQNIEELQSYYCSSCGKFFKNFKLLHSHLEREHHNAPLRAKRSKTKDRVDRKKVLYYKKY